jgi:predicted RNA methylase
MSEKRTETLLDNILITYPRQDIYYTPSENETLHNIFKNCSKTGNGRGIPDRIYYNKQNKTIIIFECKSKSIDKAKKDLQHYYMKIDKSKLDHIFLVGFSGTIYSEIETHIIYNEEEIFPLSLKFEDLLKNCITTKLVKEINQKEYMEKHISWIHNLIRDNCNLSDTDKPVLIIGILIAFQDEEFIKTFKNTNENKNLNGMILISIKKVFEEYENNITDNNLKDIIKEFNFIKIHESFKNNDILYKIVVKIYEEIISKKYDFDIINLFYSEFVKYGNLDSKTLGIVLTPQYIVELMVYLADIKKEDKVLDLCSGTGSFLIESLKYNPEEIIGCEYQNKLFNLLKCNLVLRKISNSALIKGDCFNNNFNATKSIINPPFGMKQDGRKELDFVLKQIDSTKGITVSIFPISCVNNTKFISLKREIMEKSKILTIINLNKEVFYGSASIQCCILILDTTIPHNMEKDKVFLINYEDDGMVVLKHNGRMKKDNFEELLDNIKNIYSSRKETSKSILTLLRPEDDWNFHNFYIDKKPLLTNRELKLKMLELQYIKDRFNILKENEDKIHTKNSSFFRLDSIFDIISIKRTKQQDTTKNGIYPYISASDKNNGITGYIDKMTHEGGVLTIANSGSVGSCFYQPENFCGTDSIYVLKFKNKEYLNNEKLGVYFATVIETQLKHKYSFGRALRLNKINDGEGLMLPSIKKEVDFKGIMKLL